MSRTMVAPGQWLDEGPSQARLPGYGGSLVTQRPPVKVYLPAAKSTGAPKAYSLHVENRYPICGATSPVWVNQFGASAERGAPCARRLGHHDSHRSAATMKTDRERRHSPLVVR